jgi:hypothetical protein
MIDAWRDYLIARNIRPDLPEGIPHALIESHCKRHGMDFDGNESIFEWFLQDASSMTLIAMAQNYINPPSWEPPVKSYVFGKEFWPVLQRAKLKNVSWDCVPERFHAVLRFPTPVIDQDGDGIREVMISVMPRDDAAFIRQSPFKPNMGKGSRCLAAWWMCEDQGGSTGFLWQLIPDTQDEIIPDTWNSKYRVSKGMFQYEDLYDQWTPENTGHVEAMVKALIYVCSGEPDMRSERNPLKYQGNSTTKVVKAHKPFSRLEYQHVGWNWMKLCEQHERSYTKDRWLVEPYGRYQRYGEGYSKSRFIIVTGHERQRRSDLLTTEEESHAAPGT